MTCYHPLKGFKYGETVNGKPNYIICSSKVKHIEIRNNKIVKVYEDGIISPYCESAITDFVQIPCGKCIGCRLDASRHWANRCMMEASQYADNCFITLTYNDDHLPFSTSFDSLGNERRTATLVKRDLQLFMKRLRKKFGSGIRFFACGEYGSETHTHRPHYHLILFNFDFPDKTLLYRKDGLNYYTSKSLESIWTNGFSLIGDCTWDSCCYVARYVTKKVYGDDAPYEDLNIVPPYLVCSNRPGIGKSYFENNKEDFLKFGEKYLIGNDESIRLISNRYTDKILESSFPQEYESFKEKRKAAALDAQSILKKSSKIKLDRQLAIKEREVLNKTKVLSRKDL